MAWLSGYTYRKEITISTTNVDADLTNFPLTVLLNSTNFSTGFSNCRPDGYDVVFTSSDGETIIDFEREYFDQTNSKARFHVLCASVTSSGGWTGYMYYVKTTDTDHSNPSGAWDSNYLGVWHLGSAVTDSTGNNNYGTPTGTSIVDTDYGKARSFNGSSDTVAITNTTITSSSISTAMTIIMGITPANLTQTGKYLWQLNLSSGQDAVLWEYVNNTYEFYAGSYSGTNPRTSSQLADASGNRAVIAYGHNGTNQSKAFNGTVTTIAKSFSLATSSIIGHSIGSAGAGAYFGGTINSTRLSNILRSGAWIKAESYSVNVSLHSLGAETTNAPISTPTRRFAQII